MSQPVRVQLSRKKGWRMPENTVSVARPARWGNPYPVQRFGLRLALTLFERTLNGIWTPDIADKLIDEAYACHTAFRARMACHPFEAVRELRGKNLACWCPLDRPCHADVLLEIANLHPRLTDGDSDN